jgi:phosphoesterase RecJ-like protein
MFFSNTQLAEIKDLIIEAKQISIVVHRSPDGDALGSSLGLKHALHDIFKKSATVVVPDAFPESLSYLPDSELILVFENQKEQVEELMKSTDLLFCLDFNHPGRVGDMENLLRDTAHRCNSVMIDHHQQPDAFVNFIGSKTSASSTCEMVYQFCREMGMDDVPNRLISMCLYTGIMTDTGSFRFSATTPETHLIAASLLKAGIKHWEIHEHLFNQNTFSKLQMWGYALTAKLVVLPQFKTSYISLSADELEQYKYEEGDLEGLVNYALSVKGTKMGVLLSERKGRIRISFRSTGSFSVNEFSRTHFEGGGHENAAGGVFYGTLADAIAKLNAVLPEFSDKLNA